MATAIAKRKRTKAKGKASKGVPPNQVARPKGSQGSIRRAILAELKRRDMSRNELANISGVPSTIVFEYLREDNEDRGISIRNAEALLAILNIKLDPADAK